MSPRVLSESPIPYQSFAFSLIPRSNFMFRQHRDPGTVDVRVLTIRPSIDDR
jgi:hypothetical protein